jgi:hypothetical protein
MVRGGGHGVAGNPLADDAVADPTTSEANVAWARDAVDVLEPFSSGGGYLNFPGLFEGCGAASRVARSCELRPARGPQAEVRSDGLGRRPGRVTPLS